jgi:hypothetical protein
MKKVSIKFPDNDTATKFKQEMKLAWSLLDCHTHVLTCELTEAQTELVKKYKGKIL